MYLGRHTDIEKDLFTHPTWMHPRPPDLARPAEGLGVVIS